MTTPPGALAAVGPAVPPPPTRVGRVVRFFFMHLGTLVPILVYFDAAQRAGFTTDGVARASLRALVVHLVYAAIAHRRGDLKQFDLGLIVLWTIGAVVTRIGPAFVADLFLHYSPALVFATLGSTALLPLLLGRRPFTDYYARRQSPAWQLALPEFGAISRVMTGFWVLVFFAGAVLAASRPTEPMYTTVWPNLLVLAVGLPAALWLPPLYLKVFPAGLPTQIEPLMLGMPFAFDRRKAGPARATFQFHISGEEGGDWCVHVADGRCTSFVGVAAAPDLVIRTPGDVWVRVARGELDGAEALRQGLYSVEGDLALLPKLDEWFGG